MHYCCSISRGNMAIVYWKLPYSFRYHQMSYKPSLHICACACPARSFKTLLDSIWRRCCGALATQLHLLASSLTCLGKFGTLSFHAFKLLDILEMFWPSGKDKWVWDAAEDMRWFNEITNTDDIFQISKWFSFLGESNKIWFSIVLSS